MPKIYYLPDDRMVEIESGISLLQASLKAGIPHIHVCGGNTRCTTCRVSILRGRENCLPRNEKEQAVADQLHFTPAIRLACQTKINGDVKLRRLVLDNDDIAFTSQQIVERVRAEVLAMRGAEDIANIVRVLWEGFHDIGILVDYCAIEVIGQGKSIEAIYAAAPAWLDKLYGMKPLQRNIIPRVHFYHRKISGAENITAWHGWTPGYERDSEATIEDYTEYFLRIWRKRRQYNVKLPKSWMIVPFSHGLLNIHSFKPSLFSDRVLQALKSFADAVSLAYTRFVDFQRLEQHNQELQQAYQKLKQLQVELVQSSKMASLGQLVSGISHEINTPLGALQSNLDIYIRSFKKIQKVLSKPATPQRKDEATDLTKIFANIDRLNPVTTTAIQRIDSILTSLRKFARIDRAGTTKFDIYEGLEAALELIGAELRDRIEIEKNYSELPAIYSNPDQLNQVFMNILLNAVHAIKNKGKILITTHHDDNFVIIEIRDTGSGIPKEHRERIFDPGFTTKGVGVGTGMGLSIAYNIIQNHSGKIEVESEVGQGTLVRLILPILDFQKKK